MNPGRLTTPARAAASTAFWARVVLRYIQPRSTPNPAIPIRTTKVKASQMRAMPSLLASRTSFEGLRFETLQGGPGQVHRPSPRWEPGDPVVVGDDRDPQDVELECVARRLPAGRRWATARIRSSSVCHRRRVLTGVERPGVDLPGHRGAIVLAGLEDLYLDALQVGGSERCDHALDDGRSRPRGRYRPTEPTRAASRAV